MFGSWQSVREATGGKPAATWCGRNSGHHGGPAGAPLTQRRHGGHVRRCRGSSESRALFGLSQGSEGKVSQRDLVQMGPLKVAMDAAVEEVTAQ